MNSCPLIGYAALALLVGAVMTLSYLRARSLREHPEDYNDPSDFGPGGW